MKTIMLHLRIYSRHLKVVLILFFISVSSISYAQDQKPRIHLNQLGFYPNSSKVAIISPASKENTFTVIDTKTGKSVFKGKLSDPKDYEFSGKTTRIAEFSSLKKAGEYALEIPGVGKSYSFEIKPNVHKEVAEASLKGFYMIRASTPILEQYAGKWARPTGHPDSEVYIHASAASAERPEETIVSSSKGWYDAGDYNKYIVNSGITVATMLSFYEDFPEYCKALNTNIPESNNNVPDILDENLWNIRWMLTMQDPHDGGVYHKCTEAKFSGFVMPHELTAKRYLVQKSTAAALDFAAVMAQSSRIFRKFEKELPGLADTCLTAATKAWAWAQKNPSVLYDQRKMNEAFEPDVTTGAYPGTPIEDEWMWAASELYVTTQDKSYLSTIKLDKDAYYQVPSWGTVNMLGYYSILRHRSQLKDFPKDQLLILEKKTLQLADSLTKDGAKSAYKTVMGRSKKDFIWGSSSVAANQGFCLIQAYLLKSDKKYVAAALTNLDYILGRNATGYSFVTGYGDKPTMHPHQRQSEADGVADPVPGLLAGGPNPGQSDKCVYPSNYPAESYSDTMCSYASNEIAINWNSPLVYLANAIEAVIKK